MNIASLNARTRGRPATERQTITRKTQMPQPLRIDGSQREDDDVALYRRLVRDVCYLYHQLADYQCIMGDLDYVGEFPLHYWELISTIDTGREDDRFIRSGILILMLSMLQDVFDGSGDSISAHCSTATKAMAGFIPEDDEMLRLLTAVEHGLQLLVTVRERDEQFDIDACWAYDAFVRRYFVDAAS